MQNRRDFLKLSSAATTGAFYSLESFALNSKPSFSDNGSFKLLVLATNWGFKGGIHQFCEAAKKEGYDGAELGWPSDAKGREELFAALKKHSLQMGNIVFSGSGNSSFKDQVENYKKVVFEAASNKVQKPLYINCHAGKDYYSFEQNCEFIDAGNKIAAETGVPVYHETHRGRMLFAAHITRQFIEKKPALKLTFDVSHWCNVHESLLNDQAETMNLALQRVEHIHARIGHAEGPQVNDPRAPEWEGTVKQHFAWWDKVVERKKRNGEQLTILTEFGPPTYLPVLPYTQQPVADQWAINVHMMKLLRERYK